MNSIQKKYTLLMLERRGFDIKIIESTDSYFRIPDVLVVFIEDAKVSINTMKTIINMRLNDEKIIIIHMKQLTSDAKNKAINDLNIETFTYDEMSYDFIDVVPFHTRVVDIPKEWKKLPLLLRTDAAVKYFGFKQRDIIKYEEDDGTISYRRVC